MPTDVVRSRDGQTLGPRALETRERLLDSLLEHVDHGPGWRNISLIQVAKAVGSSSANFYWHFGNAETALFELTTRQLGAKAPISPRHLAVLDLLAVEGSADAKELLAEVDEADPAPDLARAVSVELAALDAELAATPGPGADRARWVVEQIAGVLENAGKEPADAA